MYAESSALSPQHLDCPSTPLSEVWSESNVQGKIISLPNILKPPLFQTLLGQVATDSNILLAAVHLPSNGGGKPYLAMVWMTAYRLV
jgi:hypothetical protein